MKCLYSDMTKTLSYTYAIVHARIIYTPNDVFTGAEVKPEKNSKPKK